MSCAVKKPWFRSRGRSIVFVDQATQAILAHDSARRRRRHRGLAARRSRVQTLVWPCLLVVLNELPEHVLEVTTTQDQQVIQALAPDCPHPPFGERIRH